MGCVIILLTYMEDFSLDEDIKKVPESQEYGKQLAQMLAASHFSDQQKRAWAALVPVMTATQLKKFHALLKADKLAHEQPEATLRATDAVQAAE